MKYFFLLLAAFFPLVYGNAADADDRGAKNVPTSAPQHQQLPVHQKLPQQQQLPLQQFPIQQHAQPQLRTLNIPLSLLQGNMVRTASCTKSLVQQTALSLTTVAPTFSLPTLVTSPPSVQTTLPVLPTQAQALPLTQPAVTTIVTQMPPIETHVPLRRPCPPPKPKPKCECGSGSASLPTVTPPSTGTMQPGSTGAANLAIDPALSSLTSAINSSTSALGTLNTPINSDFNMTMSLNGTTNALTSNTTQNASNMSPDVSMNAMLNPDSVALKSVDKTSLTNLDNVISASTPISAAYIAAPSTFNVITLAPLAVVAFLY